MDMSQARREGRWGISAGVGSSGRVVQEGSRPLHLCTKNESGPSGSVILSRPLSGAITHIKVRQLMVIAYLHKQKGLLSLQLCLLTHQVFVWAKLHGTDICHSLPRKKKIEVNRLCCHDKLILTEWPFLPPVVDGLY